MAKIKCNHCKSKFVYVSGGSRTINFDEVHLETRLNIRELDGKYYCKECRQRFCECLIDQESIMKKADRVLHIKKQAEDREDIKHKNESCIMKFLEKFSHALGIRTPTKKI